MARDCFVIAEVNLRKPGRVKSRQIIITELAVNHISDYTA